MKAFKATWLGDEDPASQIIFMGDLRFIKGEQVTVPADHEFADRINGNPTFAIDKKVDPVEADEPDADDLARQGEEGTEKAALKAELRKRGVEVKGNPSVETLRNKLADASKDETEAPYAPVVG